jgi:diacylglycerol O-acyltransferase / wax synthase
VVLAEQPGGEYRGLGAPFQAELGQQQPLDHDVVQVAGRPYAPVSLHREQPGPARGNRDGVMVVPLPIGLSDPDERLRRIAAETAERKRRHRPPAGSLLRNRIVQRTFLRLLAHQRWANAYVANVPGPRMPLWFAGAPVVEVFPVVPLTGNVTMRIGALSYADQFNITAVADRDGCPDVEVFATGLRNALTEALNLTAIGGGNA